MQICPDSFILSLGSTPQKQHSDMKSLLHRLVFMLYRLFNILNFLLLLNLVLFLFFFDVWVFCDLRNLDFISGVSCGKIPFNILELRLAEKWLHYIIIIINYKEESCQDVIKEEA